MTQRVYTRYSRLLSRPLGALAPLRTRATVLCGGEGSPGAQHWTRTPTRK